MATQIRGREADTLWAAVGRLYGDGAAVDWDVLLRGREGSRIPLPPYPFQRTLHWIGPGPHQIVTAHEPEEATMADDLQARMKELAARHLGWKPEEIGPDDLLVELGADSLQLINLTREIESEFGVKITLRELLEETGSARRLAELITSRQGHGREVPRAGDATVAIAAAKDDGPAQDGSQPLATAGSQAGTADYATLEAVEDLARQVKLLAETQSQILTEFSRIVAMFAAEERREVT